MTYLQKCAQKGFHCAVKVTRQQLEPEKWEDYAYQLAVLLTQRRPGKKTPTPEEITAFQNEILETYFS